MNIKKIIADDGKYYEMEVPGFTKSNLNIQFENNIFSVSGKRRDICDKVVEVNYNINIDEGSQVVATIHDGILILQSRFKR